ncbi:uncharacterized protein [Montipora foliosa]|uniref:uncharacterized protein n=1 Tax=Montipora foliosa TaxID=591990 RepID=UPI0035F1A07F
MAARSSKRVSKGFHRDLNDVSTADFLKTRPATKTGPFFQVERVLSQRKLKGKNEYLIRWKGYSSLADSWETEENLNEAALRSFKASKPSEERIQEASDSLAFAILQHLKSKHQTASANTVVEIGHDIFNYIFKGKGRPSRKAGCILLDKEDFSRCKFYKECNDWDQYIDSLVDGTKILFPVRAKTFLSWAPKTHVVSNGKTVPKPRYHLQKVSLSFNKTAVSFV